MRIAPYIISICLHAAILLLVIFWPAAPPLKLDSPPIMISLVDGAPGGDRAPSPILGHMGEETASGPLAPTPPAPMSEIAAPARELAPVPKQSRATESPTRQKPEPKAIPVASKKPEQAQPEPKRPEPRREETAPKPRPEAKKEQPKKEAPKKETPRKEQPKKTPDKKSQPKADPVAEALKQAKRKASSRVSSGDRGNAIEQALAQARKGAGGTRGGGGGEGEGPGGGGLGDVYMGQVMLAVRPNWGFAAAGRLNLACVVKAQVDMRGNILQAVISQSSGNAQYDASAVNAVIRTGQAGQFPPPPSPQYCDLDLVFTFNELMGR